MVAACCREGKMEMAFELFYSYGLSMLVSRDSVSWNTMISGRQIHACAVKTGNDSDGFGVSSLIDMYSKSGCFVSALEAYRAAGNKVDLASQNAMVAACCREGKIEMAFELFYSYGLSTPMSRDSVSWNTIISGCVQNGHAKVALELFVKMTEDGATWNEHTIASTLGACSCLKSLNHGKQVHAFILKNEMKSNPFIMGSIINFYCKLNELAYAQAIYAETCRSNVFATTSMIMGHAGRGEMEEARRLFDALDVKVPPALTALLSGYLKSQNYEAIFRLLLEFRREKWQMLIFDELVLVNILIACSQQADLDHGKQVHAYMVRTGFKIKEKLGSTLLDMYAKCGEIESASTIFQHLSFKDHVSYNVMLAGFAHHGREKEALQLFEEMKAGGLWPDAVTFIAVLSACRHAGLINAGETHFNSMTQDYGISPEIDHYACMIDLYGRAKHLDKAIFMMNCIPFELDATVLGVFLNACGISGNTDMVKDVEEMMLRAEAHNGARYVQLANVFASEGEWKAVERIRRKMRGREAKRPAGCSWLHVDNRVNLFTSGDSFHSQAPEIYALLAVLSADMMETEPTVVRGASLNYALQLHRQQFYF